MQDLKQAIIDRFGEDKIKELKAKHGEITAIAVEDKIGFFKKPDRKILGAAAAHATTDPLTYVEILARNCFVEGDVELLDSDEYFLSMMPRLNALVQVKESDLVKL